MEILTKTEKFVQSSGTFTLTEFDHNFTIVISDGI